jgi:hypothetical protein
MLVNGTSTGMIEPGSAPFAFSQCKSATCITDAIAEVPMRLPLRSLGELMPLSGRTITW